MPEKIKIGDLVILINQSEDSPHQLGSIGHVIDINGERYDIEVENNCIWSYNRSEIAIYKKGKSKNLINPLKEQIGGSHYKDMMIQPVEYCQKNKLGFCESSVVKYVSRHKQKNGKQDIEKAIHLLNLLIEIEYKNS